MFNSGRSGGEPYARRRTVFMKEGAPNWVYVGYNSKGLPPAPPKGMEYYVNVHGMPPAHTLQTLYHYETFPFLPFCVQRPQYRDRLLGRFAPGPGGVFPMEEVPVTDGGPGWILEQETQDSWYRLEGMLLAAAGVFVAAGAGEYMGVNASAFPSPHRFGYRLVHGTKEGVQVHAEQSRDAFIPLFAYIFALIQCWQLDDKNIGYEDGLPKWAHLLVMQLGWPYALVDDFIHSQIFSAGTVRTGAVVFSAEAGDLRRANLCVLFLAVRIGIPVAFEFKKQKFLMPGDLQDWSWLAPTEDEMREASWAMEAKMSRKSISYVPISWRS